MILVLGTIAVDTVINVESIPYTGGIVGTDSEKKYAGGSSANVSAALKVLGCDVRQAGAVADDEFGKFLMDDLDDIGVDTSAVVVRENGVTLHTYIVVDRAGSNFIIANGGTCRKDIAVKELPPEILDDVDVFYTDMSWPETSIHLARECRKNGIKVVYNLQNVPTENSLETSAGIDKMLSLSDLFIVSRTTLLKYENTRSIEDALRSLTGAATLAEGAIVTLGDEGASWYVDEECIHVPAFSGMDVVDTTGAGDAYIAGVIKSHFMGGRSRERSMEFASRVASLKCSQRGPRLMDLDSERERSLLEL